MGWISVLVVGEWPPSCCVLDLVRTWFECISMLVILLNVSLNTLPMLAFRVIYQALKKPQRKVRGRGLHHTWRTPTARACAGNWDLKERQR